MVAMGKPTAIKDDPESDGSHQVRVEIEGFGEAVIVFQPHEAVHFVRVMQAGFLLEQSGTAATPEYVQPTVRRFHSGHGPGGSSALLVDTEQMGTLAFALTPALLDQLAEHAAMLQAKQRQRPN